MHGYLFVSLLALAVFPIFGMSYDDKIEQLFRAITRDRAEDVTRIITDPNGVYPVTYQLAVVRGIRFYKAPLTTAVMLGHLDCAKALLAHPSAVQQLATRDSSNYLPIHVAIAKARIEIIPELIEKGSIVTPEMIDAVKSCSKFTNEERQDMLFLLCDAYAIQSAQGSVLP